MFRSSPEKKIEKLEKKRDKLKLRLTQIELEIFDLRLEINPPQPEAEPQPQWVPQPEPEPQPESEPQPLQPPAETSSQKHERAKKMMTVLMEDLDKLAQFDISIERAKSQIKVARSFMRSGNYEKTLKFLQKAQAFADIENRKVDMRGPRYRRLRVRSECPTCGEEVETRWKRCPVCRTVLKDAPAEPIPIPEADPPEPAPPPAVELKCPNCGEEIETGWIRCPMCSSPLEARSDL